jgi:hypothetical protein
MPHVLKAWSLASGAIEMLGSLKVLEFIAELRPRAWLEKVGH